MEKIISEMMQNVVNSFITTFGARLDYCILMKEYPSAITIAQNQMDAIAETYAQIFNISTKEAYNFLLEANRKKD